MPLPFLATLFFLTVWLLFLVAPARFVAGGNEPTFRRRRVGLLRTVLDCFACVVPGAFPAQRKEIRWNFFFFQVSATLADANEGAKRTNKNGHILAARSIFRTKRRRFFCPEELQTLYSFKKPQEKDGRIRRQC